MFCPHKLHYVRPAQWLYPIPSASLCASRDQLPLVSVAVVWCSASTVCSPYGIVPAPSPSERKQEEEIRTKRRHEKTTHNRKIRDWKYRLEGVDPPSGWITTWKKSILKQHCPLSEYTENTKMDIQLPFELVIEVMWCPFISLSWTGALPFHLNKNGRDGN